MFKKLRLNVHLLSGHIHIASHQPFNLWVPFIHTLCHLLKLKSEPWAYLLEPTSCTIVLKDVSMVSEENKVSHIQKRYHCPRLEFRVLGEHRPYKPAYPPSQGSIEVLEDKLRGMAGRTTVISQFFSKFYIRNFENHGRSNGQANHV